MRRAAVVRAGTAGVRMMRLCCAASETRRASEELPALCVRTPTAAAVPGSTLEQQLALAAVRCVSAEPVAPASPCLTNAALGCLRLLLLLLIGEDRALPEEHVRRGCVSDA